MATDRDGNGCEGQTLVFIGASPRLPFILEAGNGLAKIMQTNQQRQPSNDALPRDMKSKACPVPS